MKRTAFLTIEVLISLVIISMGVLTVTSALKTLYGAADKQKHYEAAATTLLSLKDMLSSIDFEKQQHKEGKLNGWEYAVHIERIASQRTYVISDITEFTGNKGRYEIQLYKVTLTLHDESLSKTYTIYQTRYKPVQGTNNV
ncbi:hypothetical protein [uncultured Sulfuricurvum sp.]|uniref:type IV pilus modification PilV family protein n=1 Tax=uncultured Sulfuricurvum sp. TaxID=430693 RepID=UPI00262229A7|nr:hypothetical protein [uncultured Sulfuricurvum sp.]